MVVTVKSPRGVPPRFLVSTDPFFRALGRIDEFHRFATVPDAFPAPLLARHQDSLKRMLVVSKPAYLPGRSARCRLRYVRVEESPRPASSSNELG